MIKLSVQKLPHLNIYLLVVLTEDDETVDSFSVKELVLALPLQKLFLNLYAKTINLGKFSR